MLYEFIDEEGIVHSYKLRTRPRPIIKKRAFCAGDKAPEFVLKPADVLWAKNPVSAGNWIHSRELTSRPLVVAFFSAGWGAYGDRLLPQLRRLHQEASEAGALFLVLTQTLPQNLKKLAEAYDLDFNLVHDKQNRVALLLGAYDPNYPVWDRVAGINEDVYCPGLFVINSQDKFVYTCLDSNFDIDWKEITLDEVLTPREMEDQLKYA